MNCKDFEHVVFRLNLTDIEIKFKLDKILLVLNTNRCDFHMEYIKVKEKKSLQTFIYQEIKNVIL